MMVRILTTFALAILPFGAGLADAEKLCNFLPENDMRIEVGAKAAGGMGEIEFNSIIDRVSGVYAPIVKKYGGNLSVKRLWTDSRVNASAIREGSNYIVEMYGGMARHAAMTGDAFAMVLCHEIGHHIGGAPKYTGRWAGVEGQSDYFATMKCFRRVYMGENQITDNPDRTALIECEKRHGKDTKEMRVCVRMATGALAMGQVLAELSHTSNPKLDLHDSSVVSKTYESHPKPQCRLDTYFQGSLCTVPYSTDFSDTNADQGACLNYSDKEFGSRPLCWYKPTSGGGTPNPGPNPNPTPQPAPPPVDGIANVPSLNGKLELSSSNPAQAIDIAWNVKEFSQVGGVYIEFTRPNGTFSTPNDTKPDPNALGGIAIARTSGSYKIIPSRNLPSWGRYEIRVVPLDRTGRQAVGRASDSAVFNLQPGMKVH